MSKQKFERGFANALALKSVRALESDVERILVCGSLRRCKETVGDIEIVYIPRLATEPNTETLFGEPVPVNRTDRAIGALIAAGILEKRQNVIGREAWGPKNKLARLVKTGVPVDLFATTQESWWNYVFCRTGPAELNTRIATLAKERGWQWNPYGPGFTPLGDGEPYIVRSEHDVFNFVGLDYLEPWQR